MKDAITNEANELLMQLITKGVEVFEKSIDFASEQVPEVIEQLITWYLVSNSLGVFISLIVITLFSILIWKIFSSIPKDKSGENIWWDYREYGKTYEPTFTGDMTVIISGVFIVVSVVTLCISFMTTLKILIAPKLWLLEYAATLAK